MWIYGPKEHDTNHIVCGWEGTGSSTTRRDAGIRQTSLALSQSPRHVWSLRNQEHHQDFTEDVVFPRVGPAPEYREISKCNDTVATDRMRAP